MSDTVFLFDVDNTLLDNDRFGDALRDELARTFGADGNAQYWAIYEELRQRLGYADYLGALQRFREGRDDRSVFLDLSAWLLDYRFDQLVYPQALDAVARLKAAGRCAILSDGDAVFQPRKVRRSGLEDAFGHDNVLIFVHKEKSLDAMQRRLPADHYVMFDDKPNLLAAMKRVLGARLTTVFVRQGHYAAQADMTTIDPSPDHAIERIGDLSKFDLSRFRPDVQGTSAATPSHA